MKTQQRQKNQPLPPRYWQEPPLQQAHNRHLHYFTLFEETSNHRPQSHLCKIPLQHRLSKTQNPLRPNVCRGDKLNYIRDASSPSISILNAKIHINSTISGVSNGAHYLGLDIQNLLPWNTNEILLLYMCPLISHP